MRYNLNTIMEVAGDDATFIHSILTAFLEEVPQDVDALEKAVHAKDYATIAHLAHKIKPNVALLGMEAARDKALEIETLGKQGGNMPDIEAAFALLQTDILQVIPELKKDFSL